MFSRLPVRPLLNGFVVILCWGMDPSPGDAQEHMLIEAEAIHKELGLAPEQVTKVKEAARKFALTERKAALHVTNGVPFGSLPARQQEEMRPRIIQAVVELDESFRQELATILNADQMKRLRQLRIQALGPAVILQSTFVPEFQVAPEQQQQLTTAANDFRTKYVEENRDTLSRLNTGWAAATVRDAVTNWLVSQLNEEQQQAYRELAGEPAELPLFRNIR